MPKIAVIFKPYRSWFTQLFQKDWFWEIPEKDFYYTELTWKKYIIAWVPFEKIQEIYDYLTETYDDSYKFIISSSISTLFDNIKKYEKI